MRNLICLATLIILTLAMFNSNKSEQVELKVIDIAIDTKNWK